MKTERYASARSPASHITRDPIIQKHLNVLGRPWAPQIRNIATIGNTCNGVTSADSASRRTHMRRTSSWPGRWHRRIPIKDFYIKAGVVDIRPANTDYHHHSEGKREHPGCYIKYAMRNAMDIATLPLCQRPPVAGQAHVRAHRLRRGRAVPMLAFRSRANGKPVHGTVALSQRRDKRQSLAIPGVCQSFRQHIASWPRDRSNR